MKKSLNFIGLIFFLFITVSCSTKYMTPRLNDFSDATDLIGKNIIYAFEQLQAEEMNILLNKLIKQDSIKPTDFNPKVLTPEKFEIRKELVKCIVNYTILLKSIFERDSRNEIMKNADIFNKNIDSIRINHDGFLTKNEQGLLSTISQAIPEVLTSTKRKAYTLKIMKEMQPILEKISKKLKEEMKSVKVLIDNYYLQQFMVIAEKWSNKESKRLKYAKMGIKIIKKKNKIKLILDDLIKAIDYIPRTHKELRKSLKNKNPVYALKELINFAYRTNETYKEFAELEKK